MGSSIEARRDEAAVGARVRHCPRILRLSLAVVDEAKNAALHGGLGAGTTQPLLRAQPIELPPASHPRNAPAGQPLFGHVLSPLMAPGMEAAFFDGTSEARSRGVTVGRDRTLVWHRSGSKAIKIFSR